MDRNQQKSNQDPSRQNPADQDLPGYPHYPAEDDILNPQNGMRKVNSDVEGLANSTRLSSRAASDRPDDDDNNRTEESDSLGIVSGTDADVTEEDLAALGDRDEDMDQGDDELMHANARVDEVETEDDLDIPGQETERDDAMGQGDEENDYYSLGGDRHESLEEERPDQGRDTINE